MKSGPKNKEEGADYQAKGKTRPAAEEPNYKKQLEDQVLRNILRRLLEGIPNPWRPA